MTAVLEITRNLLIHFFKLIEVWCPSIASNNYPTEFNTGGAKISYNFVMILFAY